MQQESDDEPVEASRRRSSSRLGSVGGVAVKLARQDPGRGPISRISLSALFVPAYVHNNRSTIKQKMLPEVESRTRARTNGGCGNTRHKNKWDAEFWGPRHP
jgi:hypothetical protein